MGGKGADRVVSGDSGWGRLGFSCGPLSSISIVRRGRVIFGKGWTELAGIPRIELDE